MDLANYSSLALSGGDEDIVHIVVDMALDVKIPSLAEIDGNIFAMQNTYEDHEYLLLSADICNCVEHTAALRCEDGA